MKQRFFYVKANMGWVLLVFSLLFISSTVSANANVSSSPLLSLEQIEPLINDGPAVLAASAAIIRDEALEVWEKERTGARYFGGITYGYSHEPIFDTSENKDSYGKLSATGGLSFPLLGSLQKEKIGKLETETATMTSKYHSDMVLLNNLSALRKAYATLWIEQQKVGIAKRFLSTEAETIYILQERQAQGLVLPADKLEFLAAYHDVKRDIAASELRQIQAFKNISLATGRKWEMPEKLTAPSLPSIDGKNVDFTKYPEIIYHNKLVSQYEKFYTEKKGIDRDANLTIGLTAARDFPGSTGNGAYIAFSMSEPVKRPDAKNQVKLAAVGDLNKAKNEEKLVRLKLEGQVEEALATAAYTAAEVETRAAHLLVMIEAIRGKMLRRMVLPGDTFEQLQYSKSQYYRTALEMFEQEERFLHAEIELVSYVYPSGLASEATERFYPISDNSRRNKLLAPYWLDTNHDKQDLNVPLDFSGIPNLKIPVISLGSVEKKAEVPIARVQSAVYVWDAEPFLQSDTRTTALNEIANAGFSRVLISFTPKQIAALVSPSGKMPLDMLLSAAKSKGIRVDLLLGDPTWATAEQRGELLSLVRQLQKFDFGGIHLDIEPDSLPDAAANREELLSGLADTIKAVKEITRLPVSLSIHPRYLEGELGVIAKQKLLPIELEEVVVMIYSNNLESNAQRMAAIINANPSVRFSLAQSVEKNVPAAQSYADYTHSELKRTLRLLEDKLAGYGLKGIFIQSWEDYGKGEEQ